MTSPYEQTLTSTMPIRCARVELDCGDTTIVATLRGGTAELQLTEEFEAQIMSWGTDTPVRRTGTVQHLRVELDAPLGGIQITTSATSSRTTPA